MPIFALKKEPYIFVEDSVKNTWGSIDHENIEHFFCYGNSQQGNYYSNKELHLDCPDGENIMLGGQRYYNNVLRKTIAVFEYCLDNFDFDFLFKVNTSTYVHFDNFYKYISKQSPSQFYGGSFNGRQWASGLGLIFSKDIVELIVSNLKNFKLSDQEDVWIGRVLAELGVPKSEITPPIFHFGSLLSAGFDDDKLQLTNLKFSLPWNGNQPFKDRFLFRCGTTKTKANTESTISRQKIIHNLFNHE